MGEDRGLMEPRRKGRMGKERAACGSSKGRELGKRKKRRESKKYLNIKQGTGGRTFETPFSPPPRKEDLNGLLTVKCVWPIFSKYVNP